MFSFKLDKTKLDKISKFFGTYLDIIYNDGVVLIASEGGLSYMHLSCPAISETGDEATGFRVDSKLFLTVASTGLVEVEQYDTQVGISFFGSSKVADYKILVPNQKSYIDFSRVMSLVEKIEDSVGYTISEEIRMVRMASKLKSPIICRDGYFYIYYKNSYIFCKSSLPAFSCESSMFKTIVDLGNPFYLIEDCIVSTADDITVSIRRSRLPISSDIPLLMSGKAKFHYALDFRKLVQLMGSVMADNYKIRLNLSVNKCFISCSKGEFEVSVPSVDIQQKKDEASVDDMIKSLSIGSSVTKVSEKVLELPYWIFRLLDSVARVDVYIRRSSTLLVFNKVCIVIGGGLIAP